MKFVIGMDGGGTKTVLKIADLRGNLLFECHGGPSNINSVERQHVEYVIKGLINEGLSNINRIMEDCSALCIGMSGVDRQEEKKIMKDIIESTGCRGKIIITNDAVTALYGGVGSGEGIIMISGTGSICYGRKSSGEVYRSGGWGHIIGDEGSGYDIGVKALRHIMRSFDGREGNTLMTPMILEHLHLKSPDELIAYVYRSGAGKKEVASLAKIVDNAYKSGDETACIILKDAAYELYLCCRSVIEKLGLYEKPVAIAVSGSVLTKNIYIFNEFMRLIGCTYPEANVINMKNDAAWGAVSIALKYTNNME